MSPPEGNRADMSSASPLAELSETGHAAGVLLGPPRPRIATVEDERVVVHRIVATYFAESAQWAFTRQEAAARLGVSVEFFEQHVVPEIRCVRRGRRLLFPASEILFWLWRAAD